MRGIIWKEICRRAGVTDTFDVDVLQLPVPLLAWLGEMGKELSESVVLDLNGDDRFPLRGDGRALQA